MRQPRALLAAILRTGRGLAWPGQPPARAVDSAGSPPSHKLAQSQISQPAGGCSTTNAEKPPPPLVGPTAAPQSAAAAQWVQHGGLVLPVVTLIPSTLPQIYGKNYPLSQLHLKPFGVRSHPRL